MCFTLQAQFIKLLTVLSKLGSLHFTEQLKRTQALSHFKVAFSQQQQKI
jgi:hypothetical protein